MPRFGSKYAKIQTESQYLLTMMRTYNDSKNEELIYDYIKKIDGYIKKEKSELKVKDFPPMHKWFNCESLSLNSDLKNKLVVIDFWTYWCINWLHVLPELEYLENKYAHDHGVAFVGCHSAKFTNERESEKVREAVMKYDVKHPVINDEEMIFWDSLERTSWPSIAILSPEGWPLIFLSGEGNKEKIDTIIEVALEYYGDDRISRKPIALYLEEDKEIEVKQNKRKREESLTKEERAALNSNLRFPGKLIWIANQPMLTYDCNLLVISDTGNNRLVLINIDTNEWVDTIGNGFIGLVDGKYSECSFHHPQGICHVYRENEHFLYVCDSNNHAIREINLNTKEVLTVIGTGEQGRDREGNKNPEYQKLSSPWDIVAINRDTLIIAIAGTHQIWALNLKNNRCFNFSGTGAEGNLDSKNNLKKWEWAQPSGLSLGVISKEKIEIYVADSESSSIRAINMKSLSSSRNVVGGDSNPRNLHAYGDIDDIGVSAKLQHPLGVHFVKHKNVVLVTDTYNHKVKVIDPFTNEIFSWLGNGNGTLKDGNAMNSEFSEPSGVYSLWIKDASGNDKLLVFVSDWNNHWIRSVDYDEGEVTTMELLNVPRGVSSNEISEKDEEGEKKPKFQVEWDGDVCRPKYK